MTTFIIVRPAERLIHLAEHPTFNDALLATSLKPREVDFGTIARGLAIVVDEWSLKHHAIEGQYWRLAKQLFNGPAVLYEYNFEGATISTDHKTLGLIQNNLDWLGTSKDVEAAIQKGLVTRPEVVIGGKVLWQWNTTTKGTEE